MKSQWKNFNHMVIIRKIPVAIAHLRDLSYERQSILKSYKVGGGSENVKEKTY